MAYCQSENLVLSNNGQPTRASDTKNYITAQSISLAAMFNRPLGPRNKLVLPLPQVVLAITIIPNLKIMQTISPLPCENNPL
jgi:hypothetical protein